MDADKIQQCSAMTLKGKQCRADATVVRSTGAYCACHDPEAEAQREADERLSETERKYREARRALDAIDRKFEMLAGQNGDLLEEAEALLLAESPSQLDIERAKAMTELAKEIRIAASSALSIVRSHSDRVEVMV